MAVERSPVRHQESARDREAESQADAAIPLHRDPPDAPSGPTPIAPENGPIRLASPCFSQSGSGLPGFVAEQTIELAHDAIALGLFELAPGLGEIGLGALHLDHADGGDHRLQWHAPAGGAHAIAFALLRRADELEDSLMAFVGQRGPALGEGELEVRGLPVVGEGLGVDHLHLSRIAAVLVRAEQMEGVEQHGDLHLPGVFDTRHGCQRIGIGQEHVKLGRVVALVYHPPVFGPGMAGCGQQRGAQPSRGTAGNLAIYVHVTFLVGKCFPADRG